MKPTSTLLVALVIVACIFIQQQTIAQAPEKMSYQAVIRNSSDQLVTSTNIGMQISILEGSLTGTAVYVERQTPSTNANGLVSIEIGGGNVVSGSLALIDWASGIYFIKTETDPAGGTNYTITGISQILTVPYALYAKTAETVATINITGNENAFSGWDKDAADDFNGQYSSLTGKPVFAAIANSGLFSDLQSKPTTLSGFGITDAMSTSHAANGISATNISNWNKAYGWGNHAGLYRLVSYVPAWSEITSNPFTITAPSNNQLLKYNSTSGKWENWTPNYLASFAETDPVWTAASANYYTKTNLQTGGQALLNATNITSGTLGVARGGTGVATLTGMLIGNGTGAFTAVTHSGANQYLRRNVGNTAYEFAALSNVAISGSFNDLINKPTTIGGYGISDAVTTTGNQTITGTKIFNADVLINYLTVGRGGGPQTSNSSFGASVLAVNTTGDDNTGIGYRALYLNTTGKSNSAVGSHALTNNTTGIENTAFGYCALLSNKANSKNTAIGTYSMYYANSETTGKDTYNTAVGYQALCGSSIASDNIGNGNTAVGAQALSTNSSGFSNNAFGYLALYNNTTGYSNTANGLCSLFLNSTGKANTANGYRSLSCNTTGDYNTADGINSLYSNSTGGANTAIGYNSLYWNQGYNNTALGSQAGSSVTVGSNLTLIGSNAEPSSGTATDQITLGDGFITSLRCHVQSITSLSDARDKKNISDLSLGLDFIMKIKPRQFNWDRREWYTNNQSDGSKMQQTPTAGFIAQELDEAQQGANAEWLNLVLKDNPEKLEATYGNLLPIIVKALQEQQMQIEELKKEIALLKSR